MPHPPLQPDPDALPPAEVRFLDVHVEPWPDGRRVRVHVSLTPFQERPNLVAQILDSQAALLSQADIIETQDERFVFTMHLRSAEPGGPYRLEISLEYGEAGVVDRRTVPFDPDEISG